MDAPPIQYARTDDGVNIAYWALGEGPPLLYLSPNYAVPWSVLNSQPEWAHWFDRFAGTRQLVFYDPRGVGMSDRDVSDRSFEAMGRDLDAVVQALALREFAIFACNQSGPVAVAYAAARPASVERLLFWSSFAAAAEQLASPKMVAIRALREQTTDWDTFCESVTRLGHGWDLDPEFASRLSVSLRESMTLDDCLAGTRPRVDDDVRKLLPEIAVPTLVVHPDNTMVDVAAGRALATGISGARFVVRHGDTLDPAIGDPDSAFAEIQAFLLEGTRDETVDRGSTVGSFRTLLFTDLESSTALTQALGDAKAQELLHGHNDAVRAALAAHDGEEVKHTGDGIFAAFGSAVAAVEAALQIQRDLAGAEVRVRIGLNAGEPIAEDDDYFGTAVQLAARVCDRAEPGQILVSNVVRELCAGKTFAFTDQGEATLKGFPEPVRLFVVGGD